jgi:hypothetical protein
LNRHVLSSDTPLGATRHGEGSVVSTSLVDECYRRAHEARRSADIASMATQKTHFLELEQRWLRAGASVTPKIVRETKAEMAEPKVTNVPRRRPTKFTPERNEQIRDLVALGKSRDEIAGLLGVTVGTLQVTCSKLGISLRRRRLDPQEEKDVAAPRRPDEIGDERARNANLALTMQYRGLEQTISLHLSNEDIGKLALQADVRDISLGQLVGMLIEAAMAQDLARVLDKAP